MAPGRWVCRISRGSLDDRPAELRRPHLGEFTRPAGNYHQRAETTGAQREILTAQDILALATPGDGD